MSAVGPNPIIEALPPATDYLTYLTILEYNVTIDNVTTLNEVLQDVELATNIGWDLVHVLLPLLPHSQECLQTIARLGNPREVLLKATESLRLIAVENESPDEVTSDAADEIHLEYDQTDIISRDSSDNRDRKTSQLETPLSILKFEELLTMLIVLHARIKTKHPSRFLATTLQAVVAACSSFTSSFDRIVTQLLSFVDALTTNHPLDPQRKENGKQGQPDPEAVDARHSSEDLAIYTKLLLSFVTFVVEIYASQLKSQQDTPGWCWSNRVQERLLPKKVVAGRTTYNEMFEYEEGLRDRASHLDGFAHLAKRLGLTIDMLTFAALDRATSVASSQKQLEEDPPATPDEIALSSPGALILLAGTLAKDIICNHADESTDMNIFPQHSRLTGNFVGTAENGGLPSAGTETEPLLDSIIVLGLIAMQYEHIGQPHDNEEFNAYLQRLSLLSAKCPSPSLRYQAHLLASGVLQRHRSDEVRLAFIKDTLENCPYENLKTSAVGWMKDETLRANVDSENARGRGLLFSTPVALASVASTMFPDLTEVLGLADTRTRWMMVKTNLSFYLAVLNFYILLLTSTELRRKLQIGVFHVDNDVGGCFVGQLRKTCAEFRRDLRDGGELLSIEGDAAFEAVEMDLMLLENALDRVEDGIIDLNKVA